MLLGGLGMAIAIEKCNLHKRIAWKACILLGTKPRWLVKLTIFSFILNKYYVLSCQ